MILDVFRLRLWLQKPGLPADLVETIEWFIEQEEEYKKDFEIWCKEEVQYETRISDLTRELENTKTELTLLKEKPVASTPGRYIATGNTYPIKDLLKSRGFRWDGLDKHWWLLDVGKTTEELVMQVRAQLKEQNSDAEIVFVAGK